MWRYYKRKQRKINVILLMNIFSFVSYPYFRVLYNISFVIIQIRALSISNVYFPPNQTDALFVLRCNGACCSLLSLIIGVKYNLTSIKMIDSFSTDVCKYLYVFIFIFWSGKSVNFPWSLGQVLLTYFVGWGNRSFVYDFIHIMLLIVLCVGFVKYFICFPIFQVTND